MGIYWIQAVELCVVAVAEGLLDGQGDTMTGCGKGSAPVGRLWGRWSSYRKGTRVSPCSFPVCGTALVSSHPQSSLSRPAGVLPSSLSPRPTQMWLMDAIPGVTPTAGCRLGAALEQLCSTHRVPNSREPLIAWCATDLESFQVNFLLLFLSFRIFARFVGLGRRKKLENCLGFAYLLKALRRKRSWRWLGAVHRVVLSSGSGEVEGWHEMLFLMDMESFGGILPLNFPMLQFSHL